MRAPCSGSHVRGGDPSEVRWERGVRTDERTSVPNASVPSGEVRRYFSTRGNQVAPFAQPIGIAAELLDSVAGWRMSSVERTAADMARDAGEYERWAAELLQLTLDSELARMTRIVDRSHASLLAYAGVAGAVIGTTHLSELSIPSRFAAALVGLMGLLVVAFWTQVLSVGSIAAVEPKVFDEFEDQFPELEDRAREVRRHMQLVVEGVQTRSLALAESRRKLHEAVLISLIAGAVPLIEHFTSTPTNLSP